MKRTRPAGVDGTGTRAERRLLTQQLKCQLKCGTARGSALNRPSWTLRFLPVAFVAAKKMNKGSIVMTPNRVHFWFTYIYIYIYIYIYEFSRTATDAIFKLGRVDLVAGTTHHKCKTLWRTIQMSVPKRTCKNCSFQKNPPVHCNIIECQKKLGLLCCINHVQNENVRTRAHLQKMFTAQSFTHRCFCRQVLDMQKILLIFL